MSPRSKFSGVNNLRAELERHERDVITNVLKRTKCNVSETARQLGMQYRTLRKRMVKLGIVASKIRRALGVPQPPSPLSKKRKGKRGAA